MYDLLARGATMKGWFLLRSAHSTLVVLLMTLIVVIGLRAITRLGLNQPFLRQNMAFVDGALHDQIGVPRGVLRFLKYAVQAHPA
jgi:hypothetical protein